MEDSDLIGRAITHAAATGLALLMIQGTAAKAQDYGDENYQLRTRVQRLERDVHDLQQEIYRGNGGGAPRSLAPPVADDVVPGQAAPLTQRVSDLEVILQRLTGQIEQLQHDNDVLSQKVDRLQKEIDFQQNNAPVATTGDDSGVSYAEPPSRGAPGNNAGANMAPRALAPGPTNLGSIPQNAPLPLPKPGTAAPAPSTGGRVAALAPSGAGAQAEYDSAMALLRKAQYEAAQQAFRNFADLHPNDARAPDALFWTGDIAYSARHDYGSAARAFAELLKKYGKAGRAPEGMLKLGLSLLGLGQKQEGCATLAALPVKYANAAPALIARAAAERKRAACT